MEFPVETSNGAFLGDITVEKMDSQESSDVQYVYDDRELIMGEGLEDFSNITNLVLEDGTRAMIVNGTLVTANGQTLILQDGSDLSQYSVDDNTDEIVISKEQEDQFLQIMNPHVSQNGSEDVIRYVQNNNGNKLESNEQILYIQDGQSILPIQDQYQITELDAGVSKESMRVLKFENEQLLDEIADTIDLEQLLATQGVAKPDDDDYQYAVLKDGKLHLQTSNDIMDILDAPDIGNLDSEVFLDDSEIFGCADYLHLSTLKGRNIKSGQVISLSKKLEKDLNSSQNKRSKSESKTKTEVKNKPSTFPSNSNLRKLINKKITIGQTNKGKTLIGKIVNVMKKPDVNSKNKISKRNSESINNPRKKTVSTPNRLLKELSKTDVKGVISLINDDDSNLIDQLSNNVMDNDYSFGQSSSAAFTSCTPLAGGTVSNKQNEVVKPLFSPTLESVLRKPAKAVENDQPSVEDPKSVGENSKIIVHQKMVTKDCFDVIARTLMGLMNMDSVVKKLKNRTIIIKIIEKTYNHDKKDYTRTMSYCSGYMVREYKLDDYDSGFSESWKFIPDMNTKDTILGQNNLEKLMQDGVVSQNGLKKFANLTIQITISPEGYRTTRVIINPPALFQCKACSKTFRTSALLKVHSMDCHMLGTESEDCPSKSKKILETKRVYLSNLSEGKTVNRYECTECSEVFQTPSKIKKHMEMHYTHSVCPVCKLSILSVRDLNKHMLTHPVSQRSQKFDTKPVEEEVNDKQNSRKVFSCHICSRQFSRYSNLQRHIEIHQGEGAMFQCAVCSCSYHYISSLTRHVVSCHVDKAKKIRSNVNETSADPLEINNAGQVRELQLLQEDQIVQMIPLEQLTEESLQQYVNQNIEDFEEARNAVQIFLPMESNVVTGS